MKRILIAVITALFFIPLQETNACTSAIITGKVTPDGRPLLWKHRDTGTLDNRIEYFDKTKDRSIKYAFIALVDLSLIHILYAHFTSMAVHMVPTMK